MVIDADTHLTEPHDLWSSRAPAGLADRLPRVVEHQGFPTWVVDGVPVNPAGASGVVGADGTKAPGLAFLRWTIDDVHPAAWSVPDRLAVMDQLGVAAQIVYPNAFGLGSQQFLKVADPELRLRTVTIYNDAMAEIQDASGGRLFPMAALPFWDVPASVAEAERAAGMGLRGINLPSGPHEHGLPDLGRAEWDPLWEACTALALPVHFHIGAADSDLAWFGSVSWPSLRPDHRLGVGSAMLYLNNAAVLGNIVYSGVLERHPTLQVVSVESGAGWIPFFLEALDYQLGEMPASARASLSMAPSDYVRRQVHACFWFERQGIGHVLDALGPERLLFETDFPHPTCTYPDGLAYAEAALSGATDEVRRAVLGGNAARLYRIDTSALPVREWP